MRVYLASRFSRKHEMQERAADLRAWGIAVTSRWMQPDYRWNNVPEETISEADLGECAMHDLQDIVSADVFVAFTESPDAGYMSGGRHVEAGYALSNGMPLLVVGPRENIFYMHPIINQVDTWDEGLRWLCDYAETNAAELAVPSW